MYPWSHIVPACACVRASDFAIVDPYVVYHVASADNLLARSLGPKEAGPVLSPGAYEAVEILKDIHAAKRKAQGKAPLLPQFLHPYLPRIDDASTFWQIGLGGLEGVDEMRGRPVLTAEDVHEILCSKAVCAWGACARRAEGRGPKAVAK